jgi:ribose 5-phosphate isomerase B
MSQQRIVLALGADNAGAELKNLIKNQLEAESLFELVDFGVPDAADSTAYPYVGLEVAQAIARGDAQRGILICGTGIGMAITANKVPGIRATVAHDSYSVERSVLSNNCQILTLGARVIGAELASRLVREWLALEFDPASASAEKIALISSYEQETGAAGVSAAGSGGNC